MLSRFYCLFSCLYCTVMSKVTKGGCLLAIFPFLRINYSSTFPLRSKASGLSLYVIGVNFFTCFAFTSGYFFTNPSFTCFWRSKSSAAFTAWKLEGLRWAPPRGGGVSQQKSKAPPLASQPLCFSLFVPHNEKLVSAYSSIFILFKRLLLRYKQPYSTTVPEVVPWLRTKTYSNAAACFAFSFLLFIF